MNFFYLFFVMLILMTDLFAEQVIDSSIRNDWPDSRYTDHDDGTVTDTITGLMWKKCSEGQIYQSKSCTGTATTHNWKTALETAQKSRFADYSDWRLPDIKELGSLLARNRNDPSINSTIFPNTPSKSFWSSSPSMFSNSSFELTFHDGTGYGGHDRSSSYHVRLVRFRQ